MELRPDRSLSRPQRRLQLSDARSQLLGLERNRARLHNKYSGCGSYGMSGRRHSRGKASGRHQMRFC